MNVGKKLKNNQERERNNCLFSMRGEMSSIIKHDCPVNDCCPFFMHRPNISMHSIAVLAKVIVEERKC